jgi:hypothetical protein
MILHAWNDLLEAIRGAMLAVVVVADDHQAAREFRCCSGSDESYQANHQFKNPPVDGKIGVWIDHYLSPTHQRRPFRRN